MKAQPVKPDDAWKAEDDFRTLMRAEEIKQDPERLKKAMAHQKKQKVAITSLDDLHKAANEHFKKKNAEKFAKKEEDDGEVN